MITYKLLIATDHGKIDRGIFINKDKAITKGFDIINKELDNYGRFFIKNTKTHNCNLFVNR